MLSLHRLFCFLTLLFSVNICTLGQTLKGKELEPQVIDLSNRIFLIGEEEDSTDKSKLSLFYLFYKDDKALFRAQRGTTIVKDSPLTWRFIGDTLYIHPSPIILISEEMREVIEREPLKYGVEKSPRGYLLRGKTDQMLLIEQR